MYRPGIVLLSLVLMLDLAMDFVSLTPLRKLRVGGKWQRLLRPLDALIWAAMIEIVLQFPAEETGLMLFQGTAALSVLLLFRWAWSPALRQAGPFGTLVFWSRGMFQIPAIITLYGIWTFIDGAGFFANIVLPFSTTGLRGLCENARWAFLGLAVVQFYYWAVMQREKKPIVATPVSMSSETETQKAS